MRRTGPVWSLLRDAYRFEQENTRESHCKSLTLVTEAALIAPTGSLEALWVHATLSTRYADFGRWRAAREAAYRALSLFPHHSYEARLLPWILFALGRAYVQTRRVGEGIRILRRALRVASGHLRERIQLYLVWALCEKGLPEEALAALPTVLHHLPDTHRRAALARVLAALGRWKEARREVRDVLPAIHANPLYDQAQFRYLCDILERHAKRRGNLNEARFWAEESALIPVLWQETEPSPAVPTYGQWGGEWLEIETTPSGPRPAGYKRMGTVGTVG